MLRKVLIKRISFVEYFYKPELYFPNPVQALINELFERNIRVIELSGAKWIFIKKTYAFRFEGVVVLVVGKRPQQIQFDLLGGRRICALLLLQQTRVVALSRHRSLVVRPPVNQGAPDAGTELVGDAATHERLQFFLSERKEYENDSGKTTHNREEIIRERYRMSCYLLYSCR